MDSNQTRIIVLLREVHLIALKEIERPNLRIIELENRKHPPAPQVNIAPQTENLPAALSPASTEIMNEKELEDLLKMSVAGVRR